MNETMKCKDISTLREFIALMDAGWEMNIGRPEFVSHIDEGKRGGWCETRDSSRIVTHAEMMNKSTCYSEDGSKVTQIWRGHKEFGKDFTVTTIWEQNDDGRFAGHISFDGYEGADYIEQIGFPRVKVYFDDDTQMLLDGFLRPSIDFAPATHWGANIHSMQLCALLNKNCKSVYFDWRDPKWNAKRVFVIRDAEEKAAMHIGKYLMPLEAQVASAGCVPYEVSVKLFNGGWYDAVRIYRPWALKQSWWVNQKAKNPLGDIDLWVWNRGLVKDVIPPVEKLADDLKGCKVALDWYWWHSNPYDTDYPNFWPPREGEEPFKAAVARLNARNIYSQVYINGVCWDHDTANWKEGGNYGVRLDRNGYPIEQDFNQYNHHRLAWMCGDAPEFQNRMFNLVTTLHKTGLTGQYMDMIGNASYVPCYNHEHNHPMGGGHYNVDGFRALFKRILEANPDCPITTETSSEAYMDLVSGGIICEISTERQGSHATVVPAFEAVYHGRYAAFGNYALPDGVPPWDPLWPPEDKWQNEEPWHKLYPEQFYYDMARTLTFGAQPMVCNLRSSIVEDPVFAAEYKFILDTARFYAAHKDFLYAGEMMSPDGFESDEKDVSFLCRGIFTKREKCRIMTKKLPCVLHSYWKNSDGQYALILANPTQTEQKWAFRGRDGVIAARSYLFVNF